MPKALTSLYDNLGYHFQNEALINVALTHRSVRTENNERLEFLGDSIVNFLIAEVLYEKFPDAREGELSRLRAYLVRGETLAEMAQELLIGDYLRLGAGETKSGGHRRDSILADAFEAIVAAIYLDADMLVCKERVLAWYQERLHKTDQATSLKDPKTRLQEYVQAKKLPLPTYEITGQIGEAHEQIFEVTCTVEGLDHTAQGTGTNRRRGEQEAAEHFLNFFEVESND